MNKKSLYSILFLTTSLLMTGCEDYDFRTGHGDDNTPVKTYSTMDIAVIGDAPYGTAQEGTVGNFVNELNSDDSIDKIIHLGDTKSGSTRCSNEYNQKILDDLFNTLNVPTFYTPGDNEWTDCHRDNNGDYNPVERLADLRTRYFTNPGQSFGIEKMNVSYQNENFPENKMWYEEGVVFGLVHIVGSNNGLAEWKLGDDSNSSLYEDKVTQRMEEFNTRNSANLEWIDAIFEKAIDEDAKGIMLVWHADMWAVYEHSGALNMNGSDDIAQKLAMKAKEFNKPILVVNGDSHDYYTWKPFSNDNTHPLASYYTSRGTDLSTVDSSYYHDVNETVENVTQVVFDVYDKYAPEPENLKYEDYGWLKVSIDANSEEVFSFEQKVFDQSPKLDKLASYKTDKAGGSEIVAFDTTTKRMFTTNGEDNAIDIIDISNIVNPTKVKSIDLRPYGKGVNSVAVANGKVAVAVENGNETVGKKQLKGSVVLFDTDGNHQSTIEAGYLPDMVTFNEDASKIIVANEGEPNDNYDVDPIGSIGVITTATGAYVDINFSNTALTNAIDGTAVRLGDTPSNDQAKDLEPEYIAVSGNYAYVTLQENNAMAKVNLTNNTLEYIKSYGAKSWETSSGNSIDIEEEGSVTMKSYTGLFGLYQPDSISSYSANGETYLVTANEGDGREYEGDKNGFSDEKKISKLNLDTSIASEYENENDLKVMVDLGDTDGDGDYDKLYTYGARSFSIWDENGDLVFDSGDDISKKVSQYQIGLFNHDDKEIDGRSGNKGAEPEALTVGEVDGKIYAFVGLERQNAILIYDISTPKAPIFLDYIDTGKDGDISPEGMKFIPAGDSPNGKNLLLVSYEVSGSTVIYEIK